MTASHQAPSPREDSPAVVRFDALGCVLSVERAADELARRMSFREVAPAEIRAFVDQCNNIGQALLGSAAALENGEGK